jgi:hypothetical protein
VNKRTSKRGAAINVRPAQKADPDSIMLEQLASLATLDAYQLEQATVAILLNQAVKDLLDCAPEDHDRKTYLQGQAKAYERALSMNSFMQKKLTSTIEAKGVQAPGREGEE